MVDDALKQELGTRGRLGRAMTLKEMDDLGADADKGKLGNKDKKEVEMEE